MQGITPIERRQIDWTRLREQRQAANVSQVELARAVRVHRNTIWRTETGRTSPSVATSLRIAEAMGRSLFQLIEVTVAKR